MVAPLAPLRADGRSAGSAPPPGFEPGPLEPKSKVLPLHHGGSPWHHRTSAPMLHGGRGKARPVHGSTEPRQTALAHGDQHAGKGSLTSQRSAAPATAAPATAGPAARPGPQPTISDRRGVAPHIAV